MADRWIQCLKCNAKNSIEVTGSCGVEPGDGYPRPDGWFKDIDSWRCTKCDSEGHKALDICCIAFEGMTEEDIEWQRSQY